MEYIVQTAAYFGAAFSVLLASITAGMGEGYTAGLASEAIMRQPKASDELSLTMLASQAVTETGAIFALVVSLLLLFGGLVKGEVGIANAGALAAAGIAIGLGCIGPGFGSGYTGGYACLSVGRMPKKQSEITGNMLIGQSLAQSSAIFSLVVSLLLMFGMPHTAEQPQNIQILKAIAYIGAGLCIGLGTFGPGTGIGIVAGKASEMVGRYPRQRTTILRTMFVGSAVTESTAIYSLVTAFLLMYAL